jgi:16S rRNA (guanine966-N2)-methyltransferase
MARKQTARSSNQLRIIGGSWRGRKLNFPDGEGLRPTTDRVRETVFNWLRGEINGARCLDLFTGSGALGLEALSQGAAHCVFVEKNPQAVRCLQDNLNTLGCDQAQVVAGDALAYLKNTTGTFDLIFLDPPFNKDFLQDVCQLIDQRQLLNEDGLIYLESELALDDLALPQAWELLRNKKAGQAHYGLVHIASDDEA